MNNKHSHQGFTLIELVVVIVILAILAATAAPKFIDLTSESNTATLDAVKGSLEGASALVNGKSIVAGNQNEPGAYITLSDGSQLAIRYGYPIVPPPAAAEAYWRQLIDISNEFAITSPGTGGGTLLIYPKDKEDEVFASFTCAVTYKVSNGINTPPEIELFDCL